MSEWCGEDSPFCGADAAFCGADSAFCGVDSVFCGADGPWISEDCSLAIDIALSNTGTDCDKIYSAHSTTGFNYPVVIYKRSITSSCEGPGTGPWILVGILYGTSDSLLIGGASFSTTEVKGIDSCGADSSSIESYANACADCGGGTTITGLEAIAVCGDTELYSWNGPSDSEDPSKPQWSVTGEVGAGGGIDEDGLLTTGAGCCGTVIVCASYASCTATKEVRMPDGFWDTGQTESVCDNGNTGPLSVCFQGKWRYRSFDAPCGESYSCPDQCGTDSCGNLLREPWVCI